MVFMPHWPPKYPPCNKMDEILELLDNPHKNLPPIIHITGTNGKGSTIAFLKGILQKHELKLHIFTSPHLLKFNENFIISNQQISDSLLFSLIEEIRLKLENKIKLGFFEFQTALAFLAFSKFSADFCIIECGMGAKNDPTNILSKKLLSIITSISLDHQEYLGNHISDIALDKAHIIRCPTICAPQTSIVQKVITNYASLVKHKIFNYQKDYDFDLVDNKLAYVDITKEQISYYNLPKLRGEHQVINLIIALTALKNQTIFKLDDKLVNEAITNTHWPARLEKINNYKINNKDISTNIWFDGAHNQAGAYVLSNWIKQQAQNKKNLIIYGSTEGRNHNNFLKYFNNKKYDIIFIPVKNEPCHENKFNFQKFLDQNPIYNINIYNDLEEALSNNVNQDLYEKIIICGSLYLYRDLQELL